MTSHPPPSPNPFADATSVSPVAVVGMNIRKSDNLFQLKVILACVILACVLIGVPLGAVPGALLSDSNNRLVGADDECDIWDVRGRHKP